MKKLSLLTKEALTYVDGFLLRVGQRFGRAALSYGHAHDAVSNARITIVWSDENKQHCLAYLLSRYCGHERWEIRTEVFEEPRHVTSMPAVLQCAFHAVTRHQIVGLLTQAMPVHGNN